MTGPGPGRAWVDIRYRRLGRPLEVYRQRVLSADSSCIVTFQPHAPIGAPVLVDGRVILEPGSPVVWFTFPGAWHDIGLFHRADGGFTGTYANILTPVKIAGDGRIGGDGRTWATTDLCLDVWVGPGGRARVLDDDELARAEEAGLIGGKLAARARREAGELVRRCAAGSWPPAVVGEWTLERAMRECA